MICLDGKGVRLSVVSWRRLPSIGDITGDGKPNIVVAASDKRLYAWHINGQPVAGFPMTPRTHRNTVLDDYNVGMGFILADYSGDGKMEIICATPGRSSSSTAKANK